MKSWIDVGVDENTINLKCVSRVGGGVSQKGQLMYLLRCRASFNQSIVNILLTSGHR